MAQAAMALFAESMKDPSVSTRREAAERVPSVAMVMGKDDTENTLVPSILESVDDEDEILFTLAASLGKMKDCVHNVRLLLEPLERLAAVEETVVRDAAVKSVGQIADKLDAEGCSLACDMVLRLASADWFTGRCSACQLVPIVYNVAKHHDADKARKLTAAFTELCGASQTPMVHRQAAANLSNLAAALSPAEAVSVVLPLFDGMWKAQDESVRHLAVGNCRSLPRHLPETATEAIDAMKGVVKACVEDQSWRIRNAMAKHFAEVCGAIPCPAPAAAAAWKQQALGLFINLLADVEGEVKTNAAKQVAGMCAFYGGGDFVRLCADAFDQIADVNGACLHPPARMAFASSVVEMARAGNFGAMLPLVKKMLQQEEEMMHQALEGGQAANGALPAPEVRLKLMSGMGAISAAAGADQIEAIWQKAAKHLVQEKQWRVRRAVVEQIPEIAALASSSAMEATVYSVLRAGLFDEVAQIRKATAETIPALLAKKGLEDVKVHVVPILWDLHAAKDKDIPAYHQKIAFLSAVEKMGGSPELLTELVPAVTKLLLDDTANTVFSAARCIAELAPVLVDNGLCVAECKANLQKAQRNSEDVDVKHYTAIALLKLG